MKSTKSNCTALATPSAILLMPVSSQAATLLLSDNFNTANNTNISQNLAARQSGTSVS